MTQMDLLAAGCSCCPGINLKMLAQDSGATHAHGGQASSESGSLSEPLSEKAAAPREEMTGLPFTPGKLLGLLPTPLF